MLSRWIIYFLIYGGCVALFIGALSEWVEQPITTLETISISYWGYMVKRISVAVLAVAGIIMTYFYTGRSIYHLTMKRRYILLQLAMAALSITIVITGAVSQEYQYLLTNSPGYAIALAGAMAYLFGCIINYFYIKRKKSRDT